jgi:hypothetical protein
MVGLTPVRRLGALKARLLKGRPMKISAAQHGEGKEPFIVAP